MSEENNINLSSYEIDFDKVNDLNDVIRILKAMKITFNASSEGEYDEIMHLLKEAQTEK
jgi:hypothetical protein